MATKHPMRSEAEGKAYQRGYSAIQDRAHRAEAEVRRLRAKLPALPLPTRPPAPPTVHTEAGKVKFSWHFPRMLGLLPVGCVELVVTGPDLSPDQWAAVEQFVGAAIPAFRKQGGPEPDYTI